MMNIIGCLDVPTAGSYLLDGIDIGTLDETQLSLVRNRKIGFVFQSFNLLPRTSALENVELPLAYAGVRAGGAPAPGAGGAAPGRPGGPGEHQPNQLSGGQQQRVAVARALVTAPSLILADEPTGNLDTQSSYEVMGLFDRLNAAGRTIVLITHEDDIAEHAKRVIDLRDGRILTDRRVAAPGDLPPLLRQPGVPS